MCPTLEETTSEIPVRADTVPVEYELEFGSLSTGDTIPCPPPDWEELEIE